LNSKHFDACFPKNSSESSRIKTRLKTGYLTDGTTEKTPYQGKFSDMYPKFIEFLTDNDRNRNEQRELDMVHERSTVQFCDLNRDLLRDFLVHDETGTVV